MDLNTCSPLLRQKFKNRKETHVAVCKLTERQKWKEKKEPKIESFPEERRGCRKVLDEMTGIVDGAREAARGQRISKVSIIASNGTMGWLIRIGQEYPRAWIKWVPCDEVFGRDPNR